MDNVLVNRAEAALRDGQVELALATVQRHAVAFHGGGRRAHDREVVWIAALIRAGRTDEARQRLSAFARAYPRSPPARRFPPHPRRALTVRGTGLARRDMACMTLLVVAVVVVGVLALALALAWVIVLQKRAGRAAPAPEPTPRKDAVPSPAGVELPVPVGGSFEGPPVDLARLREKRARAGVLARVATKAAAGAPTLDARIEARWWELLEQARSEGLAVDHCGGALCLERGDGVSLCCCECPGCVRLLTLLVQAEKEIRGA
jgi:hypothetical protein